jgi:hypothetical protein
VTIARTAGSTTARPWRCVKPGKIYKDWRPELSTRTGSRSSGLDPGVALRGRSRAGKAGRASKVAAALVSEAGSLSTPSLRAQGGRSGSGISSASAGLTRRTGGRRLVRGRRRPASAGADVISTSTPCRPWRASRSLYSSHRSRGRASSFFGVEDRGACSRCALETVAVRGSPGVFRGLFCLQTSHF